LKISEIQINNWKSFGYKENPNKITFEKNLNIFIGRNSHGKTNFANALRMVCGIGPDYGGDQLVRTGKEFQERDFSIQGKPIDIVLKTSNHEIRLEIPKPMSWSELNHPKSDFFHAIGAIKSLYKIGLNEGNSWQIFKRIWGEIRNDAIGFFDIPLPENAPANRERLLSDLFVENDQLLYEAGGGRTAILYYLIETQLSINKDKPVTCFLFEEPELHMHPSLLRQLLKYFLYLSNDRDLQFFVTTHSSILIDDTLRSGGDIFQVKKESGFSSVKNITKDNENLRDVVYHQLGNNPSDILLAKTLIWVEGPSDVIYLRHWIKVKAPTLIEHKDYSFMFYGGSLISHLSFEKDIDIDRLIELCSINPNSIIMIDSDKENEKEEISDNKKRVFNSFKKREKFAWITDGREIENYIHPNILHKAIEKAHPKTIKFEIVSGQYDRMVKITSNHTFKKVKTAEEVVNIYKNMGTTADYSLWRLDVKLNRLVTEIKKAGNTM